VAVNLISYPKIELHLHLDCSLSYVAASQMDPSLSRSEYARDFVAPSKCHDLADYLTRAERGVSLLQDESGLRLSVIDLFDQLLSDHVLYAEIRFAPLLHTRRGLRPKEVVEVIDDTVGKCCTASGIEARLILCTLRHFTRDQSMETVKLVEQFQGRRVAGFDIAGDEAGFSLDPHKPAFRYAMRNSIPCTAHAGEAKGAESVWETLRVLQPSRIGHGVRSAGDTSLLEHLRCTRTHLEICPTSNVQTNVVPSICDHQINDLYGAGVSVGINTDARSISQVTLQDEYELLHRTFGWNEVHFRQCNLNAIEAAFIPDDLKRNLSARLLEGYDLDA